MRPLKNDRLLRVIRQEPVDVTPIWIMRQAGRYLPEYQQTRQKAGNFMRLCQTPELACEVTLQPLRRFDLDAAIIFSDILTIPHAMGLGLEFIEGKGPVFKHPLHPGAITNLAVPDVEQLNYVYDAIRLVQQELNGSLPLIGFCGSPWTLALYMLEGRALPGFRLAQRIRQENPALFHSLLDILAKSVTNHLQAQIDAGVQIVMIFDSWGGLLKDTQAYESFSLYYINQIISALKAYNKDSVPTILFTKGGSAWLEQMASSGCHVIGLDWEVSLNEARKKVGAQVVLQGNMHPNCLLRSEQEIQQTVKKILSDVGHGSGHIFNLGHGITPDVPPENVQVLVESVHEFSRPYHQ